MNCPFCESPRIKEQTICENELAFSFPTNIPITPRHALICPKRHVATLADLGSEEIETLLSLRTKLTKAMRKALNAEGFNFAWNEGEMAGQSIYHRTYAPSANRVPILA